MAKNDSTKKLFRRSRETILILIVCILVFYSLTSDSKFMNSVKYLDLQRNSTTANAWSQQGTTTFHLEKQRFVQTFAQCMMDSKCSIQYLHVGKTGGTFIEGVMFESLQVEKLSTCCDKDMMKRFMEEPIKYCSAPFSSYQVGPSDFSQVILNTCQNISQGILRKESGRRMVVLSTYREPLARAVSFVHQKCNKHLELLSVEEVEICNRCNYDDDPEFYNALGIEAHYRGMLKIQKICSSMDGANYLILDNADINSFLKNLQGVLPAKFAKRIKNASASVRRNPESKKQCNFKVPSSMIKQFSHDISIYRNITLGVHVF